MFRVQEAADLLPPTYELLEDEDTAVVRCTLCGDETVFYCHQAHPLAIQAAAARHHAVCAYRRARGN